MLNLPRKENTSIKHKPLTISTDEHNEKHNSKSIVEIDEVKQKRRWGLQKNF